MFSRPSTLGRCLAYASIALCLLLGGRAVNAGESFADLVPRDAVLHVSVTDLPGLLAKLRSVPQAGLLREPALREALAPRLELLAAEEAAAAAFLGSPDGSLDGRFAGPASFSVLPGAEGHPQLLLLTDLGTGAQQPRTVLESLASLGQPATGTWPVVFARHREHVILCLLQAAGEDATGTGRTNGQQKLQWAIAGPVFVLTVSSDDALIRRCLDLLDGMEGERLVGRAEYLAAMEATGADADIHLFADLSGLARLAGPVPETAAALGIAPQNIAAVGLWIAEDGLRADGFISAPGPRGGLLRALSSEAVALEPPEFVTSDVLFFASVSFDAAILWRDAFDALERENPDAADTIRKVLSAVPVNIERDVVEALGSRWSLTCAADEAGQPRMALCADLDDARSFRRAWGMIISSYPPLADPRVNEVEDSLVYKLNIGVRRAGETAGPERCVVLGRDRVAVTDSLDLANAIARGRAGDGPPLRDTEAFRELAAAAAGGPGVLVFAPGRSVLRAAAQGADLAEPALDVIERYASPVVLAGSWTEDGLHLHGFMPYPSIPPADAAQPR
jgi:hypothetical protein